MKTYTAADYLCSYQRFVTFVSRVIISRFVTCPKFYPVKNYGTYQNKIEGFSQHIMVSWSFELMTPPLNWMAEAGYKNLLHSFLLVKIAPSPYFQNKRSVWLILHDVNLFLSDLCIFVSVFIQFLHASGLPAMISIELNSTVLGVKHVRAIFELEILKILPMSRFWAWITS